MFVRLACGRKDGSRAGCKVVSESNASLEYAFSQSGAARGRVSAAVLRIVELAIKMKIVLLVVLCVSLAAAAFIEVNEPDSTTSAYHTWRYFIYGAFAARNTKFRKPSMHRQRV